jgi:hypothetical protein
MTASRGEAEASGSGLAEQLLRHSRDHLAASAHEFDLALEESRFVYGGSGQGDAAFMPRSGLEYTTAEELAAGAMLGLVSIRRTSSYEPAKGTLKPGVFAVRMSMKTDGSEGKTDLIDASGGVAASAPARLLSPPERAAKAEAKDVVVGTVGDVTITVGWVHVCFEWDDPPGTPGGICHRSCYGW